MDTQALNAIVGVLQGFAAPQIEPITEQPVSIPWDSDITFEDGAIRLTGSTEPCGDGSDLIVIMPIKTFNANYGVAFYTLDQTNRAVVSGLSAALATTLNMVEV